MKRFIILIFTVIIVFLYGYIYHIKEYKEINYEVQKYNKTLLEFESKTLYGTDLTTVMNKAIDNNEKYKIKKDEFGEYIPDDKYSTKIYIDIMSEEVSTYPMESFEKVGMKKFTKLFGMLKYKCTKVNYHDNGRVSEMFFQAINY